MFKMFHYRTMSSLSPDRSSLLSLLLDEVTGTQEAIEITQDYAKINENIMLRLTDKCFYTGSKAEGLDLPGSDDDYMAEINTGFNVKVLPSSSKTSGISSNTIDSFTYGQCKTRFCSSRSANSVSLFMDVY